MFLLLLLQVLRHFHFLNQTAIIEHSSLLFLSLHQRQFWVDYFITNDTKDNARHHQKI